MARALSPRGSQSSRADRLARIEHLEHQPQLSSLLTTNMADDIEAELNAAGKELDKVYWKRKQHIVYHANMYIGCGNRTYAQSQ